MYFGMKPRIAFIKIVYNVRIVFCIFKQLFLDVKKTLLTLLFFTSFICLSAANTGETMSNDKDKTKKEKSKDSSDKKDKKDKKFIKIFNEPGKSKRPYSVTDDFLIYEELKINSIQIKTLELQAKSLSERDVLESKDEKAQKKKREKLNERVVLHQVLFKVGDKIDAALFADTERFIRKNTIYNDAVITVEPAEDCSYADVIIYVQDDRHWRLVATPDLDASLELGVEFFDFLGVNQSFEVTAKGIVNPKDPYKFDIDYKVKNVANTKIDVKLGYDKSNLRQRYGFNVKRKFFAYNTKWAGAVASEWTHEKWQNKSFKVGYDAVFNEQDFWLARSFAMPTGLNLDERVRFIISSRLYRKAYTKLPDNATANIQTNPFTNTNADDVNNLNENFYLGSVGIGTHDYHAIDRLYYFNQYDYVPKGFNIALVGGIQYKQQLTTRGYLGAVTNYNRLYPKFGYLQTKLGYGGFFNDKRYEQISLKLDNNYFTNRYKIGKLGFRQFLNSSFKWSYDRPEEEFFSVNNANGVQGLSSRDLRGSKSFVLNFESVFYTPVDWWNSTGNFFVFADFAWVSATSSLSAFDNNFQHGYGLGMRFQSRNVGIEYLEISFGIYPNSKAIDRNLVNYWVDYENRRVVEEESLFYPSVLEPDIY